MSYLSPHPDTALILIPEILRRFARFEPGITLTFLKGLYPFETPAYLSNGAPEKYRKVWLPPLNLAILDRLTELADPRHQVKIINEYVELYHRCSKEGIQPWFSMIFGFDGDTKESVWETVAFLKKHRIWNVVFWELYRAMYNVRSVVARSWYTLKYNSFMSFINSLVTQSYYRTQIRHLNHPYDMGLFKYGK